MNHDLTIVLLTLLAAGLVVLLVWLSVVAWKSMRFKKNSESDFRDLNKRIDDTDSSISSGINLVYENIDEKQKDVEKRFDDIHKYFSHEFEELHRETINNIWRRFEEVDEGVNHRFDALERSIDSRFDKMHNLLKENEKQTQEILTREVIKSQQKP